MRLWKVLGVAGLAGVAASGVAVARAERRRRAYAPDDVRARLHERHREALLREAARAVPPAGDGQGRPGAHLGADAVRRDLQARGAGPEPAIPPASRWARLRARLRRRR